MAYTKQEVQKMLRNDRSMSTSECYVGMRALAEKIEDLRTKAHSAGRPLNRREEELIADMNDEISSLEARVMAMADKPMTLAGNGPLGPSTGPFSSFGEQLKTVMRAGMPNGRADHRLYEIRGAASGLSETVGSDGGFLLQQDFSAQLLDRTFSQTQVASRCTRVQVGPNANSIKLPAVDQTSRATGSRWGGVRGYWVSEGDEITKSKPKFRSLELNLHKLVGLCYVVDELLADSTMLENVIRTAFSDEFSFLLDDAVINGTGVGQPLGVLNAGCLVSIPKETGQLADTVTYQNLCDMLARLPGRSYRTAAWFHNANVLPQLLTLGLTVGVGGAPVFTPANGAAGRPFNTLFGLPLIPIEQCATLGDQGDIILADFAEYLLAEKGGLQAASSIHVRFQWDESVLRFVYRVDGQPVWASSLTPYKGSNAISPFIVLDARA